MDFKTPELGENVKTATVAKILVAKGDRVEREQPVIELETDKAVAEVPSDTVGTVTEVLVKEGDEVEVGQVLLRLDDAPVVGKPKPAPSQPQKEPGKSTSAKPKPTTEDTAETKSAPVPESTSQPEQNVPAAESPPPGEPVAAAPSVRRFAREIGIDIRAVPGSGTHGRVSIEDVKADARKRAAGPSASGPDVAAKASIPLPDFTRWGEVKRKPMSKVRHLTAERMANAWSVVPQVTQFGQADVTAVEQLRHQYQDKAKRAGGHLTLMVILIKTVAGALKTFPKFNASVDMDRREIILKHYCHIGVAMDTERGLVVPVLRDVDRKNMIELSIDLKQIAEKAQAGKLGIDDLNGGSFTVSNAGALGGDLFTPIVNWPEVAILGMARTRTEAVFRDGVFVPRTMLPLALSFDHRAVDGADGVRFLHWAIEALEDPVKLLWEG